MTLTFRPPRLEEQQAYLDCLLRCPQRASDYSFVNVFGWAEEYGLEWTFAQNCVWIRQTCPELLYWAPVGDWHGIDWRKCALLEQGATMIRVPEDLAQLLLERLEGEVRLEPARAHWDYVYSVPELISLEGRRFQRKQELLQEFKDSYDWTYKPIDMDCVEETLEMQQDWCDWHECEDSDPLLKENAAIARVMQYWDNMDRLKGGALHVDGHMVAYTVGEELDPQSLVIHFEKGKPEFKGVYQAINQMFLADQGRDYAWVNREQDLDDPGLRKAKLSYNPSGFLKKYTVHFLPRNGS